MNKHGDERQQKRTDVRETESEILGHPPARLLRWGYGITGGILALTICTLWLGRLPENLHTSFALTQAPDSTTGLAAQAWVSKNVIGRVQRGQAVSITFAVYPPNRYGTVNGVVQSTARTPGMNGHYEVIITFPEGFRTTFGTTLNVEADMEGEAVIRLREENLIGTLLTRTGE